MTWSFVRGRQVWGSRCRCWGRSPHLPVATETRYDARHCRGRTTEGARDSRTAIVRPPRLWVKLARQRGETLQRGTRRIQRTISIRQPHVEEILRGTKTREYRSRPTRMRDRVFLYAALRPAACPSGGRRVGKRPGDLPKGKIVGSVEIVGCRLDQRTNSYAYLLRKPKRLRSLLRAPNKTHDTHDHAL